MRDTGTANAPIDDARKAAFLEALRKTGSPVQAARVASPHCTGAQPGYASFRDLFHSDPEFQRAWEDAKAEALGRFEEVLEDRALHPPRKPIVNPKTGEIIGHVEDRNSSDRLLLRKLERLDPEWAPRKQFDGKVAHTHSGSVDHGFTITADLIAMLPGEMKQALRPILARMLELRREIEAEQDEKPREGVLVVEQPEPQRLEAPDEQA